MTMRSAILFTYATLAAASRGLRTALDRTATRIGAR